MKKIANILKFSLVVVLFSMYSCSNDDDNGPTTPPDTTITAIAQASPDLSTLVAALQRANLATTLSGNGPFTVFAPTNAAFDALLADLGATSLDDIPVQTLTDILLNHVVSGEVTSGQLSNGYVSTLSTASSSGQNLSMYVNTNNGVVLNGISTVSEADIDASNGVIHKVNAVITLPTIVTHATANPDLSSLVAALTDEGNTTFTDLFSNASGSYTVLAPVNAAFTAFLSDLGVTLDQVDNAILTNILSNHALNGSILSSALSNSYANTLATNADGDNLSLYINTDSGVTFNGVSDVAAADIIASNGVVHAVDAVIGLPTVVTFATADPNFSSLVAALTRADQPDFAGILSRTDTGNMDGFDPAFTVFAPINDAFQALLDSNAMWNTLDDIDGSLLTSVLLHHVIDEANVRSGDLTDGIAPTTLEGDAITINLPGNDSNPAKITDGAGNMDIDIIAVDVQAYNGVIHAIETVLIPNTMN